MWSSVGYSVLPVTCLARLYLQMLRTRQASSEEQIVCPQQAQQGTARASLPSPLTSCAGQASVQELPPYL